MFSYLLDRLVIPQMRIVACCDTQHPVQRRSGWVPRCHELIVRRINRLNRYSNNCVRSIRARQSHYKKAESVVVY